MDLIPVYRPWNPGWENQVPAIGAPENRALAKQYGQPTVLALWGALKKIPQRLLEALRYYVLPEADFDLAAARRCHISLNSS